MKSRPEIRTCEHCKRTYAYTFTDKARDLIRTIPNEYKNKDVALLLGCTTKDLAVILNEMKRAGEIHLIRMEGQQGIYINEKPDPMKEFLSA